MTNKIRKEWLWDGDFLYVKLIVRTEKDYPNFGYTKILSVYIIMAGLI